MTRIRPAETRDAAALAPLLAQLGYPADGAAVARRLERLLPRADTAVLVAEGEEGEAGVMGVGSLLLHPVLHEDGLRAQLTALVVAEPARGRGVGRALVRRLESVAVERGAGRIVVTTANHRTRAHGFYEDLGYAWTGRRYARALVPGQAGAGRPS